MPAVAFRQVGKNGPRVPAVGFCLMGLGIACYGDTGGDEERLAFLDRAWEIGCTNWDTSDAYGDSEELLGKWFKLHPERRQDIFLATKFGIQARPKYDGAMKALSTALLNEYCREAVDKSLNRLGVDYIDLYYAHRVDEKTPIEKTMEAMVELKNAGKIKYLGLSEALSDTLRRAFAVHPIAAVQVKYSAWALGIEGPASKHLLNACRELGVATFAYSPLGRGMLTGKLKSSADFDKADYRNSVKQLQGDNFSKNAQPVERMDEIARKQGCTASQLALAWLLAQGDDIIPIPGTKKAQYLEDNFSASTVALSKEDVGELRRLVKEVGVSREREIAFNAYADTPPLEG